MRRLYPLTLFAAGLLGVLLFGPVATASYYGHSYALVVGVDDYRGGDWQRLAYARRDAEAVEALLRKRGFAVTPLYDAQATKTAIVSALQTRLAPRLQTDDRVVVFFAGHGATERLGDQDFGYLVPYDGTADSATYLSMEELRTLSEKMGRAKHQLFILDACYGGLFGLRGQVLRVDPHVPGYLDQVTRRAAREFITAGGRDQQVLDGGPGGLSFFTFYLLEALGGKHLADLDADGAITFPELAGYLVSRATNAYETPVAGALPGHGGGEFVFFDGPLAASSAQPRTTSTAPNREPVGSSATVPPASNASPRPGASTANRLGRWLSGHLWEIFSGIGTAAVVGLLGWLRARRRRLRVEPPDAPQERGITQIANGNDNVQVAGPNASAAVERHTDDRSVHIGGDATGNFIVTGNGNKVGRGATRTTT